MNILLRAHVQGHTRACYAQMHLDTHVHPTHTCTGMYMNTHREYQRYDAKLLINKLLLMQNGDTLMEVNVDGVSLKDIDNCSLWRNCELKLKQLQLN